MVSSEPEILKSIVERNFRFLLFCGLNICVAFDFQNWFSQRYPVLSFGLWVLFSVTAHTFSVYCDRNNSVYLIKPLTELCRISNINKSQDRYFLTVLQPQFKSQPFFGIPVCK